MPDRPRDHGHHDAVIAISAEDRQPLPATAVELGAKAALPKPVVAADLVTAVQRLLAVDG
jgi:DNA-binding NarL/FixJ family response regulator